MSVFKDNGNGNGRSKLRPNLMMALGCLLVVVAMTVYVSMRVLAMLDDLEAADTVGAVRTVYEKILLAVLGGAGGVVAAVTIIGGLIFRLADEKPPPDPEVPVPVVDRLIDIIEKREMEDGGD